MKVTTINNKEINSKIESDNYSLVDMLCLTAIINRINVSSSTISIDDISNKIMSSYWKIKFDSKSSKFMVQDLNAIKSTLISKYGLSEESSEQDIEQILNYFQDKSAKFKLFALTKISLQNLSNLSLDILHNNNVNTKIKNLELCNQEFLKINSNKSITINIQWYKHIKEDGNYVSALEEMIENKLNDNTTKNPIKFQIANKDKEEKNKFSNINDLEKRSDFHMALNQQQYYCIEEAAISWLNMDLGLYEELHDEYIAYIQQYSVQVAAERFPIVSCIILIFTAVYRYNEDDASGFWPEFFDNPNYKYQRDVPCVMKRLEDMINEYNIDFKKRQYLQKSNMSVIFSQIIIPDISLRKIYSAIYIYYFRNNKLAKIINRVDFINNNEYRLDKPSMFFLSEDEIFKDTFYDMVELVRNAINNPVSDELFDFPERFYKALAYWKDNEKKELDTHTVEFYISNPNICLDSINNCIYIHLPTQKNRVYSDGDLGWNITIDDKRDKVYGRIIRKNSGDYLILEERYKLKLSFGSIAVEYFYNGKTQRTWDFINEKDFIIFNKNGELQRNDTLSREGCYLGIPKKVEINKACIEESYVFDGWNDYMFYYINLSEYPYEEFYLGNNMAIKIEDKPVIERRNFKLLFEDFNTQSIHSSNNIYEKIGTIDIIAPFISEDDIRAILFDLESNDEKEENIKIIKVNKNQISLNFEENLKSGIYNIILKYKNKTCYTESFVYDCNTQVKFCEIDYNKEPTVKTIEVYGNSDIEIIPYDLNTKIKKINNNYFIKAKKVSISRFIYKFHSIEILINKIVRPIRYDLSDLEDVIESKGNDKIVEITKEVLQSESINLYIRNLDHKYDYLTYNLLILDNITSKKINMTEKLKFGQEVNWNFNNFKDRINNFKDISVVLEISDSDSNMITRIPVLKIKEFIKIYNLKQLFFENKFFISWDEEQINKKRRLYLYNVTMPSESPLEYNLESGVTNQELDLPQMYSGVYIPIIRFKKEASLFDKCENNRQFFKKKDIGETIVNDIGRNDTRAQSQLQKCIWMMYNEEYKSLNLLANKLVFSKVDLRNISYTIIQMKNFCNFNDEEGTKTFLSTIYKILQQTLNHTDKDSLIKTIVDSSYDFTKKDIVFLFNCIIAFNKHNNLSSETIDSLAEIDLISALCALENSQIKLSNNIILQCSKKFDRELLSHDIYRRYDKIFDIIGNEMRIISDFWGWLISRNNKYLLSGKYNYSKTRMFRMYEEENAISTYKVLGRTLDDMVDNIINNNLKANPKLPVRWSNDLNVDKGLYDGFMKIINENNQSQFKDSINAAFIDVTKLSKYSNEEYFNLVMTCHMGNQKDIFNRYRAYFKLIFI